MSEDRDYSKEALLGKLRKIKDTNLPENYNAGRSGSYNQSMELLKSHKNDSEKSYFDKDEARKEALYAVGSADGTIDDAIKSKNHSGLSLAVTTYNAAMSYAEMGGDKKLAESVYHRAGKQLDRAIKKLGGLREGNLGALEQAVEGLKKPGEQKRGPRKLGVAILIGASLLSIGAMFVKSTGMVIGGNSTTSIFGAVAFLAGLVALVLTLRR